VQVSTELGNQLQQYLNLSSTEMKMTAGNMANIDTPGYRTQGFDFSRAMKNSLPSDHPPAGGGLLFASSVARAQDVDGLIARPDGNNVSMDREGLNMAEAQLKFRTGVELLKREYTRVLDAIHADK
jgi:flagellar basal-body rod protein FlgB